LKWRAISWLMNFKSRKDNILRVHYHRYDGNYDEWNLWTWDETTQSQSQAVQSNNKDRYGLLFVLDKNNYGNGTAIGLLPRKGQPSESEKWDKDAPDRIWTAGLGNEVWILQGEPQLFIAPPDTELPIAAAFVDDVDQVSIKLPLPTIHTPKKPVKVTITDEKGKALGIKSVESAGQSEQTDTLRVTVDMKFRLDLPVHRYKAWVKGYKPKHLAFRKLLDTSDYFADVELGATYTPKATIFRLFAPTATKVTLLIYAAPEGGAGQPYRLERQDHGVWEKEIKPIYSITIIPTGWKATIRVSIRKRN